MRRATFRGPRPLVAALMLAIIAVASFGSLATSGAAASGPANTAPPTITGTAREGATTANTLSHEAVARERALKELTADATKLVDISGHLREAAQEGLRRDKALRQLEDLLGLRGRASKPR